MSNLALILITSPPTHLRAFDLALIAVYLVAITLFGLRFRSKSSTPGPRSLQHYFLADRTIPWWAISLSIVSAETSTLTIISVPGVAFTGDFGFLQIVLGYLLGRIVVAAIFLPRYFQGELLTAYQLIHRRFGPTLHKVTAGLFLLTRAAAEGVRVFAISIVVGIAIGIGDTLAIAIISALTLLYTFEGGMAAVIWTDVVQMALYIAGTLVAILTLGTHVPGGWSHIHTVAAAAGKLHIFHFAFNLTQTYTFWAGLLGGTFLTMASHGTDQLMVQRMLAARNLRDSRFALLSSGLVIFLQFSLFLLIGAGLYVFYSQSPGAPFIAKSHRAMGGIANLSPDRIFPTFIVREMPLGIAGLLIAAILAAAMSNLSAALNSLSSTSVVDFYMNWRPQAPERERMLVSRASTVLWAFVLFAIAVYSVHAGGKGHVVETGLSIASVAYGCLLGVFLLGTLTRYATETGTIIGMISGFALNVYLWQGNFPITLGPITIPHIAFTWYVLIGALATFAIGSLASLLFRTRPVAKTAVTAALILIALLTATPSSAQKSGAPHLDSEMWASGEARPLSSTPPQTPDFSPVSNLIDEAIAQHKLPGAVVVIGHNGHIVFEHAYGNRSLEPAPEPMTEDTIFDMASLTKVLVTAPAIMQLYEAHKLDLDDPVAKYLPAFAVNGKQNVTIRELLTHYSGLPPDVDLKDPWGLDAPDKAEGIRRALASPLVSTPGTHFEYSDINFITLGALIEKLSGETLDRYAEYYIFTPLGMKTERFHPFGSTCGPVQILGSATYVQPQPGGVMSCLVDSNWIPGDTIPITSPTSHDLEGSPATNPDYDHLLRGTVNDPTARRMGGVAGHAGVFSTARDTSLYAQALLDKLLHNTGPFPLSQSTLQLMTSPQQPPTAESSATIFTPSGDTTKGVATRGLGWDLNSAFSRPRGTIFPITTPGHPGSFGHTGFTGTSLWIDPTSDTWVILLANSVHPRIGPNISPLRGQVATAAALALGLTSARPPECDQPNTFCDPTKLPKEATTLGAPQPALSPSKGLVSEKWASSEARPPSPDPPPTPSVLTGIDTLEATHFSALAAASARHHHSLRLGLLTNQTGLDAMHRRTIDILFSDAPKSVPGLSLKVLFSPEHGILGARDTSSISNDTDPATHLPVISLYGPKDSDKRPRPDDLRNLDAVVIDLQDAGIRFFTYESVLGYFLEAAARENASGHPLEIIVLDRPNPIGGLQVQGPLSDAGSESYTDYMPLPIRHGLTFGELARYINGERRLPSPLSPNIQVPLNASLSVIPMTYWRRNLYFDQTGLDWINPSPNLRSITAATLYPGVALLEYTPLSVGRGTSTPYEHFGAPFINAPQLAAYLNSRNIPGVSFSPDTLSIAEDSNRYPYHGHDIPGVRILLTDRQALDSPELGIELLSALHRLYPHDFDPAKASLLVNSDTLQSLEDNQDPRTIAQSWAADLTAFRQRRLPYLLYPTP